MGPADGAGTIRSGTTIERRHQQNAPLTSIHTKRRNTERGPPNCVRLPVIAQLLNFAFKVFRVTSFEELLKRLLKIVFWLLLLIPLVLLPLYFLFFSALVLR